jgi:hypothetical protein
MEEYLEDATIDSVVYCMETVMEERYHIHSKTGCYYPLLLGVYGTKDVLV